jgi:hypothetical protein
MGEAYVGERREELRDGVRGGGHGGQGVDAVAVEGGSI